MRKPTITIAWALFAAAAGPAMAAGSAPQPYRMEPPSAWVSMARDIPFDTATPVESGESDYLLVEHQLRIGAVTEHYQRFVERLMSQDDVDDGAQISIDIDPQHERVQLHDVRVLRNGRAIDKLGDARRSLLNREENLEAGIIDGRVTLHVLLQDVRVGDVLDYSYTVATRDPFGNRGYSDFFTTQWTSPVRRFRLRILNRADRPLRSSDHSQLGKPAVVRKDEWIETTWSGKDIPALASEDHRPSWFFFFPRIEISESADWNAVRAWSAPMFTPDKKDGAALAELLATLESEPDPAARIVRALRFVQDDVRYTGLEIGAGAFRPTQPATVLTRRYGDCKDKVFLLVTLLRELGVEAWPVLVNSRKGRGLAELLPSSRAFDHAIAKVRFRDRDYWLDATVSGQGGTLDNLVQADFGLGLVLDGSSNGLDTIPERKGMEPGKFVVETFDFRKGSKETASFRVKTEYREEEADEMRVKMRTNTATAVGKDYLDFYRKSYAGVRMMQPLVIEDDRAGNVITIEESYEIDKPFKKSKAGDWKFHLEAHLVTDHTATPGKTERTTPLARAFPMHVRHQIVVYLPEQWDIDEEQVKVSDPAFQYTSGVLFRKNRLQLDYDLRSTSDHVEATALEQFVKNLDKVDDDAYFTLTDKPNVPKDVGNTVTIAAAPGALSPEVVVTTAAGLLTGIAAALGLLHLRRRLPVAAPDARAGVAGWMLLPRFLTVVLPFLGLQALRFSLESVGTAEKFMRIGDALQLWHLATLFTLSLFLAPSAVAVWLMLKRAARFPWAFAASQAIFMLALAADAGVQMKTARPLATPASDLVVHVLPGLICVLGIFYVLLSQRVRATFVNPPPAAAAA